MSKKYKHTSTKPKPTSRLAVSIVVFFFSVSILASIPFSSSEAAIARENSATCGNNGDTTLECSITAPANGNALVAVIGMRGAASVSSVSQTGASWSQAVRSVNGDIAMEIWYAVDVSSAGTAVTFNLDANEKSSAVIAEYSDVTDVDALDVTATNTGSGTTVSSGTTATTSQADQVWVGGFANVSNDTYSSPTNSFAIVGQDGSGGGPAGQRSQAAMLDRIVSDVGTASTGATLSGSNDWAGGVIALNGNPVPTQISITTPSRTLTAGVCNGNANVITIEVQDAGGSPIAPANGTTVRMSSNSPDYTVFSDSTCSTEVSDGDFVFNGSQSSRNVYIIDRRASDPTYTLSADYQSGPDVLTGDTQSYTVNPGATSRLVVTPPGQTFTAGSGNSGSPNTQTAGSSFAISSLTATDDYFNITTDYSGSRTITYTGPGNAPDGTPPAYTNTVNFSDGESTTTLTTTLYRAESANITAEEGGLYGFSSSAVSVVAGLLDYYEVTLETPIIAGECSSDNLIRAKDQWDNNRTVDTSTVLVTHTGESIDFYTSSACTTTASQYALSGGETAFYIRSELKQGSFNVEVTKSGDVQTGISNSSIINPAALFQLLTVLPGQSFVDGSGVTGTPNFSGLRSPNATSGITFSVNLRAVDEFNNLLDTGSNDYSGSKTVDWGSSTLPDTTTGVSANAPSTPNELPATSVGFTNGSSSTLLEFTIFHTGEATVRVEDALESANLSASTAFTVQANEKDSYYIIANDPSQSAGQNFNVFVAAIDQWNNVLDGTLYSAPSGTYSWSTNASNAPDGTPPNIGTLSQSDFSEGVATKSVTLYNVESGITFSAGEPSGGISGTQTDNPINVSPGFVSSAITSSTISGLTVIPENTPIELTITLRDAWQNPMSSGVSAGNIIVSGTDNPSVTQPTSDPDTNGQTTAEISWASRGEKEVFVEIDGVSLVTADGQTADSDGFLDDTLQVEVVPPEADARIRGGTTIRGGSTIR